MFPPLRCPCGPVVISFYLGGHLDRYVFGGGGLVLQGPGVHAGVHTPGVHALGVLTPGVLAPGVLLWGSLLQLLWLPCASIRPRLGLFSSIIGGA